MDEVLLIFVMLWTAVFSFPFLEERQEVNREVLSVKLYIYDDLVGVVGEFYPPALTQLVVDDELPETFEVGLRQAGFLVVQNSFLSGESDIESIERGSDENFVEVFVYHDVEGFYHHGVVRVGNLVFARTYTFLDGGGIEKGSLSVQEMEF